MEPTQRSREEILEELAAFPDELRRLLFSAHDDDALYRPGSDGGWGIVEILPHLRDWEEIFFERAQCIVSEDDPEIPGYDDALWPIERDYSGQDPRIVFDEFAQIRKNHVEFLYTLPAEAWDRTGQHSLYGRITLTWLEDHVCDHDSEHLDQAREVLAG
ncbi:MAG: DinB family protein [Thermomicrobiales bacterium]|nr:DinB family protein [Thermomicrobiales bacterium]MCO5220548.1 DinB family protein [Thermomicrobiales bacterium]